MKLTKYFIFLFLLLQVLSSLAEGYNDRYCEYYERLTIAPSRYVYDSVIGKKVFKELSLAPYYDGRYYRLARYEFDETDLGQILYQIIDSCQKINCFRSLDLSYYADCNRFSIRGKDGAYKARGVIFCKDSQKPLYIDHEISDSLLAVTHIRKCTDSLDVKYIFSCIALDRNGFGVIYTLDEKNAKYGLAVTFEDQPVDSVPYKVVREHWNWLGKYRPKTRK